MKTVGRDNSHAGPAVEMQALVEAYAQVWATDAGQIVLNDLIEFSGLLGVSDVGDNLERREGMRAVGNRIFGALHLTPAERESLIQAVREETLRHST